MQVQQLAELEEIILHKAAPLSMPLALLVRMWRGRLAQAQLDADVWQDVLSVRYLVASPARDVRTWLKFGALCRKSGRGALAHKILVDVLGTDPALVRLTLSLTLTLTLTLTLAARANPGRIPEPDPHPQR